MIWRAKKRAVVLASLLSLALLDARACSLAAGYFYQVSALKGKVVGTTYHRLPRWLRQSFAKKHAKLVLYDYRWPRARNSMPPIVKTVGAGRRGEGLISAPCHPVTTRSPLMVETGLMLKSGKCHRQRNPSR